MSWFTPTCPVPEDVKEWTEQSFLWLLEEFSEDAFVDTEMVLPNDRRFPDRFLPEDKSIFSVFEAVCEMMMVERSVFDLEIYEEPEEKPLAYLAPFESWQGRPCGYEVEGSRAYVRVNRALTSNPSSLISVLAHQLSHHILASHEVEEDRHLDEEYLTDLATIFFGMGIFKSNSIFVFNQFTNTMGQGWKASTEGFIDEETAGYALACFAYMKGESKPIWKNYLETNPAFYYKKSLNYLVKTGDTSLKVLG